MKNLLKLTFLFSTILALTSCRKTEFNSVSPSVGIDAPTVKVHEGSGTNPDGTLFTDKDKCKKCHTTTSRTMGIVWSAPYMSDNSYLNIEELVANYDFANNVHLKKGNSKNNSVSSEEMQELISYLKQLESGPSAK
jgi:hypothetical protein